MPFESLPYAAPVMYDPRQSNDRITELLMRQGDIAARGAAAQGDIWGNTVANLGQQAGQFLQQRSEQKHQQQRATAINDILAKADPRDPAAMFKALAPIAGPEDALKIANGYVGFAKMAEAPEKKMDWEAFHHTVGGLADTIKQAGPEGVADHWSALKSVMDPYTLKLVGRPLGDKPNPEDIALIQGYDQRYNKQAKGDDAKPGSEEWYIATKFGPKPTPEQVLQGRREYSDSGRAAEKSLEQIRAEAQARRDPEAAAARIEARDTARMDKSFQFNSQQLENVRKPLIDQSERFNRLVATVDARTPQADALIAPELLTVMAGGSGSGVRMTEAEMGRIIGGRSKIEDLKAALNKWQLDPSKALTVTDAQRAQIKQLIGEMNKRISAKVESLNDAAGQLVDAKSVEEHRKVMAGLKERLTKFDAGSNEPKVGDTKETQFGKFRWDGTGWEKVQ